MMVETKSLHTLQKNQPKLFPPRLKLNQRKLLVLVQIENLMDRLILTLATDL